MEGSERRVREIAETDRSHVVDGESRVLGIVAREQGLEMRQ